MSAQRSDAERRATNPGSVPGRKSGGDYCRLRETVASTDVRRYRHFAVDLDHEVLYFCDVNSYKGGMNCFSSLSPYELFTSRTMARVLIRQLALGLG